MTENDYTPTSAIIRKCIVNYRKQENISISEMARRLNIDYATCSNWMSGNCNLSVDKCDKALRNIGLKLAVVRIKK